MSTAQVLCVAVLVLAALLAVAIYIAMRVTNELMYTRDELQCAADAEHAKCIGAVAAFIGNEWAAQILEVAADDYTSPKAHADLDRIGRLVYRPGGEPVPSLWLRERADRLRVDDQWGVDPVADVARINYNEVRY